MEFIEADSLLWLLIFFVVSLIFGCLLLTLFNLTDRFHYKCAISSLIGHVIGGFFYYYVYLHNSSDSLGYFVTATSEWSGYGSGFMLNVAYVSRYLFGDLYLSTCAFFIFIGFLGSMLYFICFHQLVLRLQSTYELTFNFVKLKYGYFLIACWPSAFFWTSNLGKDSLCYFAIALFFLSLIQMSSNKILSIIFLLFSGVLGFMVRPYLLVIVSGGYFLWMILGKKNNRNLFLNIFLTLVIIGVLIGLSGVLVSIGGLDYSDKTLAERTRVQQILLEKGEGDPTGVVHGSFDAITARAVTQQKLLTGGSGISAMPNRSPLTMLIFLPYTMFANLFFPLFFFIRNAVGVVASCQNVLLIFLSYKFLRRIKIWRYIRGIPMLGYMFWYFIVGIGFLGMINTNLGVADREKLMYLPPFLIIMFLTLSIRSIKREPG